MAKSSITITGLDAVLKNLSAYAEQTRGAAAMALFEEAHAILKDSLDNYVPVDQRGLRSSGHVKDVVSTDKGVSVTLEYDAVYAATVHENPRAGRTGGVSPQGKRYRHWAATGGWKYLERPFLAAESGMLKRLGDRIRDIVGGRIAGGG